MTDTLPLLLPTVPGKVHGIVSLDPPTVQCDGCAATYTGRTLARAILDRIEIQLDAYERELT